MTGDGQARICEGLGVKFPGATRRAGQLASLPRLLPKKVANREQGTIEKIDADGNFRIRFDSGRAVSFNIRENPHLDHGYAVTSHSSQGQTADRVLIHVDTAQAGEKLVNRRLAYVAISRGRYDAQIYTNDKTQLAEGLGRDVSHRSAIEPRIDVVSSVPKEPPERERDRDRVRVQSHSISR